MEIRRSGSLAFIGLAAAIVVAGCGAAASSPAPTAPAASPVESMMEHSPMPSAEASMMEHSPMPSVAAAVSMGTFHAVDGSAMGTAALFDNADGSFTLTFEDFSIGSAAHTNVVLVTNKDVTSDSDIDKTAIVDLGPLKGTSGMQDFSVPHTADAMTLHTVVLWDTEMAHAIAAAPLHE